MRQAELLDECKEKLEITSDYALAGKLEISRMRISDYRKGRVKFDEYAYFKIADVLGISPAVIIAQVQMENEKKPNKALIFKHFLTAVGLWIILAVIPVNYGSFSNNAQAAGNRAVTDIKAHYTKLLRLFRRWKKEINFRYFTCNWHVKYR